MDEQDEPVRKKPARGHRNADEDTAVGWMAQAGLATENKLHRIIWKTWLGQASRKSRSCTHLRTNCRIKFKRPFTLVLCRTSQE